MPISLDAVAKTSRAVVETNPDVELITVASVSAESQRVELLVTLARSPYRHRRVLLNLSRKEPFEFERQLRADLREVQREFNRSLDTAVLADRPDLASVRPRRAGGEELLD